MSQIEISLLLHRKVLHWFIGAACLKNKLSQKYSLSSHRSFAICGHQQLISSTSIISDSYFKNSL